MEERMKNRWLSVTALTLSAALLMAVSGCVGSAMLQKRDDARRTTAGAAVTQRELTVENLPQNIRRVFADYDSAGEFVGYTVQAVARGLYSNVAVNVSVTPEKNVLRRIAIASHGETEYIGDKIEKPSFTEQFSGRRLPVKFTGEDGRAAQIDWISGATYSSRAVVDAVNAAYDFLKSRQEAWV